MVVKTLTPILKEGTAYPEDNAKAWHKVGIVLEVTQDYGHQLVNEGKAEILQTEGHLATKPQKQKKTGAKSKDEAEKNEQKNSQ